MDIHNGIDHHCRCGCRYGDIAATERSGTGDILKVGEDAILNAVCTWLLSFVETIMLNASMVLGQNLVKPSWKLRFCYSSERRVRERKQGRSQAKVETHDQAVDFKKGKAVKRVKE